MAYVSLHFSFPSVSFVFCLSLLCLFLGLSSCLSPLSQLWTLHLFLPYVSPLSLPSNSALCLSSSVSPSGSPLYLSSLSHTLSLLSVSPLFSTSSPSLCLSSSDSIPPPPPPCLFPSVYTHMSLLSVSSPFLSPLRYLSSLFLPSFSHPLFPTLHMRCPDPFPLSH